MCSKATIAAGFFLLVACTSSGPIPPDTYHTQAEARKVVFATAEDHSMIIVLQPCLLESLFGADWYRQALFEDRPLLALGQRGNPTLIWKEEGLMFGIPAEWISRFTADHPYWISLYSAEKAISCTIFLDCKTRRLTGACMCHVKKQDNSASPGGVLYHPVECLDERQALDINK